MKITAEFNSNEELLDFIGAFGAKSFASSQGVATTVNITPPVLETKKVIAGEKKEDKLKDTTPIVDAEIVSQDTPTGDVIDADIDKKIEQEQKESEEPKVTKEMVRERLGVIMKAGKQKEAKELVAKYGATGIPTLKEEDYASVYKEAEALL